MATSANITCGKQSSNFDGQSTEKTDAQKQTSRLVKFIPWVTCWAVLVAASVAGNMLWGGDKNPARHYQSNDVDHTGEAENDSIPNTMRSNPRVIKVTDGVFVAIGYALANTILIEAPDGAIIVDVTESMEAGRQAYNALRNVTNSHVKAIIYTHSHADHVHGSMAFVDDPEDRESYPDVWAYHTILENLRKTALQQGEITFIRAMRQFGTFLPSTSDSGIGLNLKYNGVSSVGFLAPNKFLVGDQRDVIIAGLPLKLIHIPGETEDQMAVWIPSKQTLLCGDNYYRAFPNLYAIRGSVARDLIHWVASLDRMRALNPVHLVPGHTEPISGRHGVYTILTNYRDAIQFIHDQTLRYINKGLTPDEIVERIKLPSTLKNDVHLRQIYGTVPWSVRGVFSSYLGWFSGRPEDLNPLSYEQRGERMVELLGNAKLLMAAEKALFNRDPQWALELTSFVLTSNNQKDKHQAGNIRQRAMKALASQQTSATGRNYYLTSMLEESGKITIKPPEKARIQKIKTTPMKYLMNVFPRLFNAESCGNMRETAVFYFYDSGETYTLKMRNSILEVIEGNSKDFDYKVTTSEVTFRKIMSKERNFIVALFWRELSIQGNLFTFRTFMVECLDS